MLFEIVQHHLVGDLNDIKSIGYDPQVPQQKCSTITTKKIHINELLLLGRKNIISVCNKNSTSNLLSLP